LSRGPEVAGVAPASARCRKLSAPHPASGAASHSKSQQQLIHRRSWRGRPLSRTSLSSARDDESTERWRLARQHVFTKWQSGARARRPEAGTIRPYLIEVFSQARLRAGFSCVSSAHQTDRAVPTCSSTRTCARHILSAWRLSRVPQEMCIVVSRAASISVDVGPFDVQQRNGRRKTRWEN